MSGTRNETNEPESSEVAHETTIFAEPVFQIGNFNVTNSLINTWLVVLFFMIIALFLRKKLTKIPTGIQNLFEIMIEGALSLCDSVTGNRVKSLHFFPLVFVLFAFILVSNWTGLIPGVGSI